MNYRNLLQHEIEELEAQGCYSNDWQQVTVTDDFDPAGIHNAGFDGEVRIGSGVHIRNVGIIRTTDGATFGENVTISVQNEAGDGNLILYSGLTSQTAALMVRNVDNKPLFNKIKELVAQHVKENSVPCTTIGDGVTISDCRELTNVNIGPYCELSGASRLVDCTLSPTPEANIYIGDDVIMENVIAQAGATIVDGAKIYDTFVGEACHIGRGFTS